MAHYLVTGGAGFIGSNIVRYLISKNQEVTVIDNLSTGKMHNIETVKNDVNFLNIDVCNVAQYSEYLEGIQFIIHQAAIPSVPRSISQPLISNQNNITGTLHLLEAAKKAGIKRFVFASSSSIYGHDPRLPKIEDQIPRPKSPYALTKLTGEYYCKLYFELFGLETVCLRYFNVFGPNQDPYSQYAAVIPAFIRCLLKNKPPTIFSDGDQTRDFTFVKNVVLANVLATQKPAQDIAGQIFNIGCGQRTSVFSLYRKIASILNSDIQPNFESARPGDVRDSYADISKASKILSYIPEISIDKGLEITIDYFKQRL